MKYILCFLAGAILCYFIFFNFFEDHKSSNFVNKQTEVTYDKLDDSDDIHEPQTDYYISDDQLLIEMIGNYMYGYGFGYQDYESNSPSLDAPNHEYQCDFTFPPKTEVEKALLSSECDSQGYRDGWNDAKNGLPYSDNAFQRFFNTTLTIDDVLP